MVRQKRCWASGSLTRDVRDRIVLATKVSGKLTRQRVISSAEESLKRLQTDRIDLFQLHSWDGETRLSETLAALTELVEQGKVRAIGCSNWSAWHLCKALLLIQQQGTAPLVSTQPPYNLVQREIESDLLPLCVDQQIGTISYSPLAAGFLTGKYGRGSGSAEGIEVRHHTRPPNPSTSLITGMRRWNSWNSLPHNPATQWFSWRWLGCLTKLKLRPF